MSICGLAQSTALAAIQRTRPGAHFCSAFAGQVFGAAGVRLGFVLAEPALLAAAAAFGALEASAARSRDRQGCPGGPAHPELWRSRLPPATVMRLNC